MVKKKKKGTAKAKKVAVKKKETSKVKKPGKAADRKKNVLITGVTGTVGSRLAEALYAEASGGGPFLLWGSSGYLEIAVCQRRADEAFGIRPGEDIELPLMTPQEPER